MGVGVVIVGGGSVCGADVCGNVGFTVGGIVGTSVGGIDGFVTSIFMPILLAFDIFDFLDNLCFALPFVEG